MTPMNTRRSNDSLPGTGTGIGLRNSADAERRNPKAELKKVDASQGGYTPSR